MAVNLVVFASGNGTNAEQLVKYFKNYDGITVSAILTNNPKAGVIQRAENLKIPTTTFTRHAFDNPVFLELLAQYHADFLILAGFLWKIPEFLIDAFPDRILNLHPALLPKYGGKGMYGRYVHEAVLEQGDHLSGITVHLVNKQYDKGQILFQASCPVLEGDTVDILANRIHQLEHEYFPRIVADYIGQITARNRLNN